MAITVKESKGKIKTVKKERTVKSLVEEKSQKKSTSSFVRKFHVMWILIIIVIVGLLYYFKGLFLVATVNGEPITRLAVVQQLEKQGGKQTLSSLVSKTLILQEAKKQHVTVSQEEVNREIKKIEDNLSKQGQKLDDVLRLQGASRQDVVEQVKTQKLIEKMLGKDIKVEDKELDEYLKNSKEAVDQSKNTQDLRKNAREQLMQEKERQAFSAWLEKLQKNAKINYFVIY